MISHSGGGEKAAPFSLRSSAIRERDRREVAPGKIWEGRGRRRRKWTGRRKGPSINDGRADGEGGLKINDMLRSDKVGGGTKIPKCHR